MAQAHSGEQHARRIALQDPLTGLPNRAFFIVRLAEALMRSSKAGKVSVFYLDLDRFKAINDLHGHGTGDAALRIVAARLTAAVRADDLVCRIGGDEFVCLLLGVPDDELLSHIACKLLDGVAAPLQIGSLRLETQPSIGIASWPEDGTTPDGLVANADAAMFHAKRRGCGYAFYKAGLEPYEPLATEMEQCSKAGTLI
ncbi:MAG: GGDEF domain-containing protein [Burkholderiaceae bacterium]